MKVVFCLPGSSYSGRFLQCWSDVLHWCLGNGIQPMLSQHSSCNIYMVRNMCLGADVLRGKHQAPFNGSIDYDCLMWIDSDQVFGPPQLDCLLKHEEPIVGGIYKMSDAIHYAAGWWDRPYFLEHGSMPFLTDQNLADREPGLVEVDFSGFGFLRIRRGVFENPRYEYPWFRAEMIQFGAVQDISMEDVYFCRKAAKLGLKTYVDPKARVGHEKLLVL